MNIRDNYLIENVNKEIVNNSKEKDTDVVEHSFTTLMQSEPVAKHLLSGVNLIDNDNSGAA